MSSSNVSAARRIIESDGWHPQEDWALLDGASAFAVGDGEHSVSLYQGVEMGRPSHIRLRLRIEASRLTELMIGGDAVKVAEGTLLLDQ